MSEFLDKLEVNKLDRFEKNKRNWLVEKENYYSETSIVAMWGNINSNCHIAELSKNKDLYDFSETEIKDIIKYAPTINVSTKRTLFTTISKYIEWACEKGLNYVGNPCDTIDINELLDVNMKAVEKSYQSLDEFYKFINGLKCSDIDRMLLVLLRYGVKLNYTPTIRWDDLVIDEKGNKILEVRTESDYVLKLPVDDRFVSYVEKAKDCTKYSVVITNVSTKGGEIDKRGTSSTIYTDMGYMIKINSNQTGETVPTNTLRNRINLISSNNDIVRISIAQLNRARRFDLLIEALAKKGYLHRGEDVEPVVKIFEENVTDAKVNTLINNFELFSGMKIANERSKGKNIKKALEKLGLD